MSNLSKRFFGFFLLNFAACCISFFLFFQLYFFQEYSYEKCNALSCIEDNFRHIYIYYFSVFFYLNIIYWGCFFYLSIYKDVNKYSVKKWLVLAAVMFVAGLTIYAANKYYRGIWSEYSLPQWWASVFLQYINDIVFKYRTVLAIIALITSFFNYLAFRKVNRREDTVNIINFKHFE